MHHATIGTLPRPRAAPVHRSARRTRCAPRLWLKCRDDQSYRTSLRSAIAHHEPASSQDHSWLWENTVESDVMLLIYPAGGAPNGSKPEPVARLPLHRSALAHVFPDCFWYNLEHCHAHGSPAAVKLACVAGEPEAVPVAVLRHAYTGTLPDEAHLLAWMVWRALDLGMQATMEASLARLSALAAGGKLSLQDLVAISSLPPLEDTSSSRAAVERQLAHVTAHVLQSQLGVAREAVADQQLLGQFVQLPLQLVKQWATLESVVVDSENTVAVLLTAWYDHHLSSSPSTATSPHAEQQCKELSALLCLDKLSASFHLQALPHLKWYRPPAPLPKQHAVLRALAGLNAAARKPSYQTAFATGGVARRLQPTGNHEQLQSDAGIELVANIYLAGYDFTIRVELQRAVSNGLPTDSGDGRRAFALFVQLDWPAILIRHGVSEKVPDPVTVVRVDWEVDAAGDASAAHCAQLMLLGTGVAVPTKSVPWGWSDGARTSLQCESFEELASFVGKVKASTPDQATEPTVTVTLSDIC